MKSLLVIFLIVSSSITYAITDEKLNKALDVSEGPVSIEFVKELQATLVDIGQAHIFDEFMEALRFSKLEEVPKVLRFCELSSTKNGEFFSVEPLKRNNTMLKMKTINSNLKDQPQYIKGLEKFENGELFEFAAYESPGVYVFKNIYYPIICLNKYRKFGLLVRAFAHEAKHLIGHFKVFGKNVNIYKPFVFESVEDYTEFQMKNSSGEFNAFVQGYIVGRRLKELGLKYVADNNLDQYFEGEKLVDPIGFNNELLLNYNYAKRFKKEFFVKLVDNNYKSTKKYKAYLEKYLKLNLEHLSIYEGNIRAC